MIGVFREISFKNIKNDLSASIIVFLVALPLCLGIALASGAPIFSGIIAGIIGGIVVGFASGSSLGVSGPAAGLAVIVLVAIESLGSWQAFLAAVVLAGIFQILMGYARLGFIAYLFPSSVIKGMLSGIGLLIILKQIPHVLGFEPGAIGDFSEFHMSSDTTLSHLIKAFSFLNPGVLFISFLSILIFLAWDLYLTKKNKIFEIIQAPIVVIALGVILNILYQNGFLGLSLNKSHLVQIPESNGVMGIISQFSFPDFESLKHFAVWKVAIVIALVASIETLLCVDATDKLDPQKRMTPVNRELKAQGLGNFISGLIGGLPITQVIIRSSANINFGAKTKLSAILHGIFLLLSATVLISLLNKIPLASLAAILIVVGYKLAKPEIFKKMFKLGAEQFVPFIATVIGLLLTDLLRGIVIGLIFGIFFTLKSSYHNAYRIKKTKKDSNGTFTYRIILAEEVSFFNKSSIMEVLYDIPENSNVIIDYSNTRTIAYDIVELINDFKENAVYKNINVKTIESEYHKPLEDFDNSEARA